MAPPMAPGMVDVREVHLFPRHADRGHDVRRCWCDPEAVRAVDDETGEWILIVTHDPVATEHEIVEVP